MNHCQTIKPLIYLYREGELFPEEKLRVLDHAKTCPSCTEVLRELHSIESALTPLRHEVPVLSDSTDLVAKTMNLIAEKEKGTYNFKKNFLSLDDVFGWVRTGLSLAVLTAVALFISLEAHDAMKIARLENRLRANGNAVTTTGTFASSLAQQLIDVTTLEQRLGTPFSSSLNNATFAGDPTKLIGTGFLNLLKQNGSLFEDFSRKYPNLSTVRLEDGIDEREQKILETEGRAFISEFEQLLHEGKK